MTSESVILKKEATLLLLLTKCLMIFSDLVRLKDVEMLMLFLWQSTKDLPVPSGCSWGIYTMTYPVFITRNEGCKAKSESLLFFPVDLARERATKRAPGLLDSNALVPGLITIYILTPPSPIVMP